MSNKDYIPTGDSAFLAWTQNLITYATDNAVRMEIDEAHITPLTPLMIAYSVALAKTQEPNRGTVDTKNKNTTRKTLVTAVRAFVNAYVMYNPKVTDADRLAMGLHVRRGGGTPVQPPHTWPDLRIDTGTPQHLIVHYRDPLKPRGGKPDNVKGMELIWALRETPPEHNDDLVHSSFDTRSPLDLAFDLSDQGKRVYMRARWEIEREGINGPDSPVIEAVVP
jgi:hypothetical protein